MNFTNDIHRRLYNILQKIFSFFKKIKFKFSYFLSLEFYRLVLFAKTVCVQSQISKGVNIVLMKMFETSFKPLILCLLFIYITKSLSLCSSSYIFCLLGMFYGAWILHAFVHQKGLLHLFWIITNSIRKNGHLTKNKIQTQRTWTNNVSS